MIFQKPKLLQPLFKTSHWMSFGLGAWSKRLSRVSKALPDLPVYTPSSLPYVTHSRPLALLFLEYILLVLMLPVPFGSFSCRTQQGLLLLILKVSALNLPWALHEWQTLPLSPHLLCDLLVCTFLSFIPHLPPRRPLL